MAMTLEYDGSLDIDNKVAHKYNRWRMTIKVIKREQRPAWSANSSWIAGWREETMLREATPRSLDEIEKTGFSAKLLPLSTPIQRMELDDRNFSDVMNRNETILDGSWELCRADEASGVPVWEEAISAPVPGSVHTALFLAGRIPDPTVGMNQKIARLASYKRWYYRKVFQLQEPEGRYRLEFRGVCNICTIWLNGVELGEHEGMFGGPEYDVSNLLQKQNELIVRIEAIPFSPGGSYPENNASWKQTVVINNVYGWHYSNMPSLGIWRSVRLVEVPEVEILNPFIVTKCLSPTQMLLQVPLTGPSSGWEGVLHARIESIGFTGRAYSFEAPIVSTTGLHTFSCDFIMQDARLWWPVDHGDAALYSLTLSFVPRFHSKSDSFPSFHRLEFGIRTVEMSPLPGGPYSDLYNWTFIINGKRIFAKGTGWCTADAMLDLSNDRIDRFLKLARDQHCQLIRAWGAGMPETDEFYQLCDRYGMMVIQEWPTAWNSHRTQPYRILEDTVVRNTYRLRNHPSLVMWGAGNESSEPFGEAIDMMGRLSIEMDGTRPFHRGEPFGGSDHNYTCYWNYAPLDHNLTMTSRFFGEFGLACMPSYESVQRYLPEEDRYRWPFLENPTLCHHTPIFGHADDANRILQYAGYFIPKNATLAQTIVGSQLSQAVGIRHPLERARTRWPESAGALYYKMNDNYPAASWACVDWYGTPKIGYYFIQDAFAPLHACVLFSTLNLFGTHQEFPVFLLDDAEALTGTDWKVIVRAFDNNLTEIHAMDFSGSGSIQSPFELGRFVFSAEETRTAPLLITSEVRVGNELADRTFYFVNHEIDKGCLFELPRTSLHMTLDEQKRSVTIHNVGKKPAVAVHIDRPGHLHEFTASDNYFWLEPGEVRDIQVNSTQGISVSAWNSI